MSNESVSFKPVTEMTEEEIAAEARKILLSPLKSTKGQEHYSDYANATDHENGVDNDDSHSRSNSAQGYGSRNASGNVSARSALRRTPRDTFGDDSRVEDHTDDNDGSLSQRSNRSRRVIVSDERQFAEDQVELIDLPVSLALLYQAAYAVQLKRPCENLKRLLLDVAVVNGVNRLGAEAEAERQRRDACHRLYTQSTARKEKIDEQREKIRSALLQKEDEQCTFKPIISERGQEVRRNYHTKGGKVDYVEMSKQSQEWLKTREKKLKAKSEKQETEYNESIKESIIPMSEKSKRLAERHRAKAEEKRRLEAAITELTNRSKDLSGAGLNSTNVSQSPKARAFDSMSPIRGGSQNTNTAVSPSQTAATEEGGNEEGQHDTSGAAPTSLGGGDESYGNNDESAIAMDPNASYATAAASHVDPQLLLKLQTFRRRALDDRSNLDYYPSFEPVTNSGGAFAHYFQNGGSNSPWRKFASTGGESDTHNSSTPMATTPGRGDGEDGQTVSNARIVQRLLDDVEQRKVRQAERIKEAEERKKEKLYDPVTGQPFFQPNAVPTVVIGRKRIPVSQLPKKEQEEAAKILKTKKLDFLLSVAKRKECDGSPQRDINAFLKYCSEMQAQAVKRVEKVRRLEEKELEGLFVPKVDENSRKMTQHKANDKVYNRELPRKAPPPPPEIKKESDGEAIKNMIERSKQWADRREMLVKKKLSELEKEAVRECSFNPKLHKSSAMLTAAAEQRLAGELAMLRSQSEQMQLEDEQRALSMQRGRNASQSVRSVGDRSSVSVRSNENTFHQTSGSLRRERASNQTDESNLLASSKNKYSPAEFVASSPASLRSDERADGSIYVSRDAAEDTSNKRQAAAAAAATQPPPAKEKDIDDLLNSWKELDEMTDVILRSGSV